MVKGTRHKNSYHTFLQFMKNGIKIKSIHKLLVELSSEVRRFGYYLRLLITIGFKSDYKLLEHDYKILNIGNIKCQVDLLVIRGRECLWDKIH